MPQPVPQPRPFSVGLARREDLPGILRLQRENLRSVLTPEEIHEQGFVTVVHTPEILEQMHALSPSVVARSGDALVGYALAMPVACRRLIPLLDPLFAQLETLSIGDRPLKESRYYVGGQVCVARSHRGTGLFDALYQGHAEHYASAYDWLVTEISTRNPRSIRAHARVGFREIAHHQDAQDDWSVVAWDFRQTTRPSVR